MDKPLSEMTREEILAEIARMRERRAINRSNALSKARTTTEPRAKRSKVETIDDDLEALLG